MKSAPPLRSSARSTTTKIGLALSGGGVRGLVHLGVLRTFEEQGLPVDYLAGTSMGGLIAGAYGAGIPLDRIVTFAVDTKVLDFASPDRTRHGLFDHRKMAPRLAELLGSDTITFEDLRIPVAVTAADLETGGLVVLDHGPLIPALLATSALPLFFAPVHHNGRWLIDGGVLNNLPLDVVRRMGADRVLGVTIPPMRDFELTTVPEHANPRGLSLGSLLKLGNAAREWRLPFLIAQTGIGFTQQLVNRTRMELCPPDLLLEVPLPNVGILSTEGSHTAVEAGYRTSQQHLDRLRALTAPMPAQWRQRYSRFHRRLSLAWRILREPEPLLYPEAAVPHRRAED